MASAKATLQQNSNFADHGERPWLPFLVGTNIDLMLKILALTCRDSLFHFCSARNVCPLLLPTPGFCSFLVPIHFMWCLKEWFGGQAWLRPMQRKMQPLYFSAIILCHSRIFSPCALAFLLSLSSFLCSSPCPALPVPCRQVLAVWSSLLLSCLVSYLLWWLLRPLWGLMEQDQETNAYQGFGGERWRENWGSEKIEGKEAD